MLKKLVKFTGEILPLKERGYLMLSLIFVAIMNGCIPLLQPVILKLLFDALEKGIFSEILFYSILTAVIVLAIIAIAYVTLVYADLWASNVIYRGIGETFIKIHDANDYILRSKYDSGNLLNCINAGCSSTIVIWVLITNFCADVFSILFLGGFSFTLTSVLLPLTGILVLIDFWQSWFKASRYRRYEEKLQNLYGNCETDVQMLIYKAEYLNMTETRKYMEDEYKKLREETWEINFKKILIDNILECGNSILTLLFKTCAVLMVCYKPIVTVGSISSLFSVFDTTRSQLGKLRGKIVDISTKFVPIQKYNELLDLSRIRKVEETRNREPVISLENVNLSINNKPILSDISLDVYSGEKILLVGKNGSGKSTLVKMMLGLFLPDSGTVKIKGVDSSQLDYNQKRSCFSYIPSSEQIFSDTIEDNVLMGAEPEEDPLVNDILQGLFVQDQTVLDEEKYATELSGGQKQRVSVARGLIHDAEIVFADEPTASLDNYNGDKVMTLLKDTEATLIAVTHNPEYVRWFDKIIVLNEGRIVANGNPSEIRYDRYYRAWIGGNVN